MTKLEVGAHVRTHVGGSFRRTGFFPRARYCFHASSLAITYVACGAITTSLKLVVVIVALVLAIYPSVLNCITQDDVTKMPPIPKRKTEKAPPIDKLIKPAIGIGLALLAYQFFKGLDAEVRG